MKDLGKVVIKKDKLIFEHTNTIAKLTEGNCIELQDLKDMFFSKNADLVMNMKKSRE